MKRRIFEYLLYRYQQNEASKKERILIDRWYDQLDRGVVQDDEIDEQQLWDSIQEQIGSPSAKKTSVRKMLYWTGAVAASLLLCLGILLWGKQTTTTISGKQAMIKPGYRTFETGIAQRKRVQLADGSTVILNARSKIKLDTVSFNRKNRCVELIAGEAFFEIKRDSSKAFIVRAQQIQTTVLGTSFTVRNYAELDEVSVSVFTGKVKVASDQNLLGILERGEQIRYGKDSHASKQDSFDLVTRNSWIEGRVYLKQASFEEMALAIHNIYDIAIVAANTRVAKQRYTMPISKQLSWNATLESIKNIHHNRSRKEGNKVLIY